MSKYYQVAVNFPKRNSVLTYKAEQELNSGSIVEVPLGRRKSEGIVLREQTQIDFDESKIKGIGEEIDSSFSLSEKELTLYEWMHKYYHYPLGKLVFDCFPKILKRPRKVKILEGENQDLEFSLNSKQEEIVSNIQAKFNQSFQTFYVHGVTGSGKSVIYLKLMQEVLKEGKSVQFLLPEINLTPQFTEFFKKYLDCPVLIYHSGVSASEKYVMWKYLKESVDPVLVMGVRSSIFLPVENLGLVVVDEEHDQSFKQTDRCPYNGRDVAIKKAQISNAPIVLGSATPAIENYHRFVQTDNYFKLKERAGEGHFPQIQLVDLKGEKADQELWPFRDEAINEMEIALNKGEQVLVFINKLGFSNSLQCRNCGYQFFNEKCGCENNLRYFKSKNILSCSYCDYYQACPQMCPECGSLTLQGKGFGTEKVEEVLRSIFPTKTIDRFDRDLIKNTKDLKNQLDRFANQEIDILVGTQMLAKGHNFEKVNLVVVLGIDSTLSYSDYRSTERAFQLLAQISGRAGRYSKDSKIVIQTLNKDHRLFEYVQGSKLFDFYPEELPLRELCQCPPFVKVAVINFSSRFQEKLIPHIQEVARALNQIKGEVQLQGPFPQMVEKKANQYTWGILLKSLEVLKLHQLLGTFESNYQEESSISMKIDVDPLSIL